MRCPNILFFLISAFLATGFGSAAGTAALHQRGDVLALVRSIPGKSWKGDEPILSAVWEKRRAVAIVLIQQVDSHQVPTRSAAMYLLGLMRLPEGVPVLVRRLEVRFMAPPTSHAELGPASSHPAIDSLISIGMPSVRAILKALPQETNALRRKLMVRVLVGVEGRAVTRFRLKRAIAKAPNAAAKANLKAALGDVATAINRR